MHADEPSPNTSSNDNSEPPPLVTVTGTDATADRPVEMIEGVTGARMPTGDHPTSGAMPDQSAQAAGGSGLSVAIVVVLIAGALLVIIKLIV